MIAARFARSFSARCFILLVSLTLLAGCGQGSQSVTEEGGQMSPRFKKIKDAQAKPDGTRPH